MIDMKEYEAMAMLDLPDDERGRLEKLFGLLTDGFAELEKINTDGTEPLVTVLNLSNILREDIAEKLLTRDELLSNAPEQHDGYFKVPGSLE